MPKYKAVIPEVHYSTRLIEADSLEEAQDFVFDGEEMSLEYSHTLYDQIVVTEDEDV